MTPDRRGLVLVVLGVLLFATSMAASAALAPTRDVSTQGTGAPETLVGSQGGGVGYHYHGSVYLLSGDDVAWRADDTDSYFDVTKLDNGSVLAAFVQSGYSACGPYDAPCSRTGFRIIDPDPTPHVVYEYSFPVRTRTNSEVHDVEPLPGGGYVLTGMDRERIFVVRDGEVTWQWNASGFYRAPDDPTRTDWLHINDVDRIGEGRYLVSVRNANQLVVVQRGEGVVEVINEDETPGDGVRRGDPSLLNHQHNPQWLGEGAVLVADSENNRVVELHRTADGTWEPAWTLARAGGIAFRWPRDADRLPNGNTLVTDSRGKRLVEVNESGDVVWSRATERIPYEADRLPHGELVGAPRYGAAETETETETPTPERGGDIPLLSTAVVGLRSVAPGVPYWFAEAQLLSTLVSLCLVVAGAGYRLR